MSTRRSTRYLGLGLVLWTPAALAVLLAVFAAAPAIAASGSVNVTLVHEAGTYANPWTSQEVQGYTFKLEAVRPDGGVDTWEWSGAATWRIISYTDDADCPSCSYSRLRLYVEAGDGGTLVREWSAGDVNVTGIEGGYAWLLPFPPPASIPVKHVSFYVYDPGRRLGGEQGWELVLRGGDTCPGYAAAASSLLGVEATSAGNAYTAGLAVASGRLYEAVLRRGGEEVRLGLVRPEASAIGLVVPLEAGPAPGGDHLVILYDPGGDEFTVLVNASRPGAELWVKNSTGTVYQASFSEPGNYTVSVPNATSAGRVWAALGYGGGYTAFAVGYPAGYRGGEFLGLPLGLPAVVVYMAAAGFFLAFTRLSWPLGAVGAGLILGVGIARGAVPPGHAVFAAAAVLAGVVWMLERGGEE